MSIRGVRQLKELVIRYSDYDGSSRGIREWLRLNVVPFASKNPSLVITTEIKRAKHPYIKGLYANNNSKIICIKNEDVESIDDYILFLRNQVGKKVNQINDRKFIV